MAVALVLAILSALTFNPLAVAQVVHYPWAAGKLGPGHSGFGQHHIVPLVVEQHAHSLDAHRGFAGCAP